MATNYRVHGTRTISVWVDVTADSPEQAKEIGDRYLNEEMDPLCLYCAGHNRPAGREEDGVTTIESAEKIGDDEETINQDGEDF